jgi:hypothetical protein
LIDMIQRYKPPANPPVLPPHAKYAKCILSRS